MAKIILITAFLAFLGGCATDTEMPSDPKGVDEMRISPCACVQFEYKKESYTWRG